jgi:hypothetical protein
MIMRHHFLSLTAIVLIISSISCSGPKKEKQTSTAEKKENSAVITELRAEDYEEEKRMVGQHLNGVFGIKEVIVEPSPDEIIAISFSAGEKVIDYDVSPMGCVMAALISDDISTSMRIWDFKANRFLESISLPDSLKPKSIAYHPGASSLFVMGEVESGYAVYRMDKKTTSWTMKGIYFSTKMLRRLVVGPRPFVIDYDRNVGKEMFSYRLFLGMENVTGSFSVISITENGDKYYQVVGPKETVTQMDEYDEDNASDLVADWMLPLSFHPAGHKMILQNKSNEYFIANYSRSWYGLEKLNVALNRGTITPTPNGLGFIHWQKDESGIGVFMLSTKEENVQLTDYKFIWTPSSVPDGKGVVGLSVENGLYTLTYAPIVVPLHDVVNAWMYANDKSDLNLFSKHQGLFRSNHSNQMYKLYESENYYCNGYDRNSPTRPYLVTTDIFWELFGAAFQGIFIVKERDQAIPAFWEMVSEGNKYLTSMDSPWKPVFQALSDLNNDDTSNPEVQRIVDEEFDFSDHLGMDYDYSALKPMGHYDANDDTKMYFKAFRYFNTVFQDRPEVNRELNEFPPSFQKAAGQWIDAYKGFIAPTNAPLVFRQIKQKVPAYCQFPSDETSIFPLSWGFDNEILNSTIYHSDFPEEIQITGPEGHRLLPSGVDLAAATGSQYAMGLLKSDLEKYPPLNKVLDNLSAIYNRHKNSNEFNENIYNRWVNAMVTQWIDIEDQQGKEIWQAKRLQTGLATWATLRHATILVNETGAAECGEGGFEELLMRAPRGFVEPDTATFEAIARLFDYTVNFVDEIRNGLSSEDSDTRGLYTGIKIRLEEAAKETRTFKAMAAKELGGMALSDEENDKILYVARVAEHLFLIFNSIGNDALGLADPDPIAKIANVSGGKNGVPFLMAAVGNTMEWDHIVPFYGRKQIVKGAIYSYYEFESDQLLDDNEWNQGVETEPLEPWIKPFTSQRKLYGIAETLY